MERNWGNYWFTSQLLAGPGSQWNAERVATQEVAPKHEQHKATKTQLNPEESPLLLLFHLHCSTAQMGTSEPSRNFPWGKKTGRCCAPGIMMVQTHLGKQQELQLRCKDEVESLPSHLTHPQSQLCIPVPWMEMESPLQEGFLTRHYQWGWVVFDTVISNSWDLTVLNTLKYMRRRGCSPHSPMSSGAVSTRTEAPHGYCRCCASSARQLLWQGQDLHKVCSGEGSFRKGQDLCPQLMMQVLIDFFFNVMFVTYPQLKKKKWCISPWGEIH